MDAAPAQEDNTISMTHDDRANTSNAFVSSLSELFKTKWSYNQDAFIQAEKCENIFVNCRLHYRKPLF